MQSCFINALSVCLSVCLSLFPRFCLPYVACFPPHRGRDLEHCTLFILRPPFFFFFLPPKNWYFVRVWVSIWKGTEALMTLLIDERFVAVVEDLFSFRSVQMENERTGSVDFLFFSSVLCRLLAWSHTLLCNEYKVLEITFFCRACWPRRTYYYITIIF